MNVLKDKCVEYFIEKRLYLDEKALKNKKQQETLSVENTNVKVDLDKYHTFIIASVLIYLVLAFILLR